MRTIKHWIGGKPSAGTSSRRGPVWNPATGEQQAEVVLASKADVDEAILVAGTAFESWSQSSLSKRTKILFDFRELVHRRTREIAEVIADEHGKVVSDAMGEVQRGLEVVEYACGIPTLLKGEYSDQVSTGVDVYSFRQPLGVVAGSLRSTSRSWCRCGCTRLRSRAATRSSSSRASAIPPRRPWSPSLWAEAGLPDGRVQRRPWRQGGGRRDPGPPGHRRRVLRRVDADRPVHP